VREITQVDKDTSIRAAAYFGINQVCIPHQVIGIQFVYAHQVIKAVRHTFCMAHQVIINEHRSRRCWCGRLHKSTRTPAHAPPPTLGSTRYVVTSDTIMMMMMSMMMMMMMMMMMTMMMMTIMSGGAFGAATGLPGAAGAAGQGLAAAVPRGP
jgi:hypothetical protein